MVSASGVQHYLARTFSRGRILLAGDAAHVVSPIGGQGMNLGWLDTTALAAAFQQIDRGEPFREVLAAYHLRQRTVAKVVMARATLNMRLGRKSSLAPLRNAVLKGVLSSPSKRLLAYLFNPALALRTLRISLFPWL